MSDELTDDQSHYEISLTAGQAFVAFVLLLLSLAASFAFGLLIGRNQTDDHLVVRKDSAVIAEGGALSKKDSGKNAELSVNSDDFKSASSETTTNASKPSSATTTMPPSTIEQDVPATTTTKAISSAAPAVAAAAYAQLLSTSDQKIAEAMAAKLIEGGFSAAYVERMTTDRGTTFRVRVKFPSEDAAHAAEAKLKTFSRDVWITKQ